MEKVLLSISGPTAIGKTDWAIRIATHFQTEILSSDSRQFYREIPIGTAQPSANELQQVPHHFIGHLSVLDPYSVGDFRRDAIALLHQLFQTHAVVVMVGGSGLYMDAVTRGLDEFPEVPPGIRSRLQEILEKDGLGSLQEMLREKDPVYYGEADLQNPRRLLRALEVCLASGKPYSSYKGRREPPGFFRHIPLGIRAPREVVYARIERRVDRMVSAGLLEEARALYQYRHLPALQTVGYQELFRYMEGHYSLDKAVEEIKKNTRRFAKRQGTWLRRNPDIHWIDYQQKADDVFGHIETRIGSTA